MSSAPSEQGDVASRPPESGDFGAIRVSIRAAMAERRQTALGVARARFVEGLPRKARELRASLALLAGTPDEERPREELRRRLHALYASAQVFRIEPLALALKDALAEIDEVRDARRGFTQDELDRLANLAATLPALGRDDEEPPGTPSVPVGPPEPAPAPVSAPRAPPPRAPKPRAKAHGGVSTVVGVLVVDAPEAQAQVRAALPPERFEVVTASSADEGLRLARAAAPDVVLANRAIAVAPETDLIGRLRDDPLTDFVPVVLLVPAGAPVDPIAVRDAGADAALSKPLEPNAVLKTVERVASSLAGPAGASTLTGDLTVEELAEALAEEVKRGIVTAAEKGRDVAVPVGDGTELLAATWSAIGRVRAHIAERSGGRVRFREAPARGGPAFVSVVGEDAVDEAELPEGVSLGGRRILVCDDDPAVVWFFAGLFREHGADVVETADGLEALEEARRRRPDLVLSDILMPRLDGFGLTRALKRDPVLADVPVILLSWKEDFLQRMRELKAGASGYLRKEAAAVQILAAVREALRPRLRLESRLRAGGDVRGRLEEVGLSTLLTTVAAVRPNARLSVRDASSLYELDLRGGELVDVNRTLSDGTFARGPRVLEAMLGTTTGRYTVADADGPVRRSLEGSTAALIDTGMRALAARVDAVSGKNLTKVHELELDEEALATVLRSSPEQVERVVELLREGRPPRELIVDGVVEAQVLEEVLTDLARQGAIRAVRGPDGEDRVALARAHRDEARPSDSQELPSWFPTAPAEPLEDGVLESLRPPPGADERPLAELEPPPARQRKSSSEIPILDEPFGDEPESVPPPAPDAGDEDDGDEDDDEPELETSEWDGDDEGDADDEDDEGEDADETDAADEEGADERDEEPGEATDERAASAETPAEPAPERTPAPAPAEPARAPQPARRPPPQEAGGAWPFIAWATAIVVLAATGYVAWQTFQPAGSSETVGPLPPEPRAARPPEEPPEANEPAEPAPPDVEEEIAALPAAYGREEPGIAEVGASVATGQGLVVLEPAGAPVTVQLGSRRITLEDQPVGLALDPGVHHLTYERGDKQDFIWIGVRAGHTRFVPPLP